MRAVIFSIVVMVVTPVAARDAFRNLLSDTEFTERSRAYVERLEEAKRLASSGMPASGHVAVDLVPGSFAESAGIVPGHVAAKLGDQLLWGFIPWGKRELTAELVEFSATGEKSVYNVPPGTVGVYQGPHDAPELAFLRAHDGVDGSWTNLATLGLLSWNEDPDLSESAWFRAMAAGYQPDEFSRYALLILSLGDPDVTVLLGKFLEAYSSGEKIPHFMLDGIVSIATSVGNIAALKRIVAQESPHYYWSEQDLGTLEKHAAAAAPHAEDLLTLARSLPYEVVSSELRRDPRFSSASRMSGPEIFQKKTRRAFQGQNSLFRTAVVGAEPIRNAHVSVLIGQVAITQVSRRHSNYFSFGFATGEYRRPPGRPAFPPPPMTVAKVGMKFLPESVERYKVPYFDWVTSGVGAIWRTNAAHHFGAKVLSNGEATVTADDLLIDLIRIDNVVACYVNEVCYLRMPVDPAADDLSVFFALSGAMVEPVEFLVRRLP